jgi:hypothetical protein
LEGGAGTQHPARTYLERGQAVAIENGGAVVLNEDDAGNLLSSSQSARDEQPSEIFLSKHVGPLDVSRLEDGELDLMQPLLYRLVDTLGVARDRILRRHVCRAKQRAELILKGEDDGRWRTVRVIRGDEVFRVGDRRGVRLDEP